MKLHFRKIGEGRPIVILHGVFGFSDNWQTLGKKLSEDHTVYLVDLRNHGRSPHSDEFNYDVMAEDVQELFKDEGIEDAVLVGHSMGGKAAMRFAQSHPEKLDKLVVVDMGPKPNESKHDPILDALCDLDLDHISSRREADEELSKSIDDWGIRQFLLKNLYWKEKGKLGFKMNLPIIKKNFHKVTEGIPRDPVDVPTLFIRGGRSDYIKDDDIDDIKLQFPYSDVRTIEKAGHWVHAEAPEEFLTELKQFIS